MTHESTNATMIITLLITPGGISTCLATTIHAPIMSVSATSIPAPIMSVSVTPTLAPYHERDRDSHPRSYHERDRDSYPPQYSIMAEKDKQKLSIVAQK